MENFLSKKGLLGRICLIGIMLVVFSKRGYSKPLFVTTIHPIYELISEIVLDKAEVIELIEPGTSPELYDPSPSEVKMVKNALATIYASNHLDGWITGFSNTNNIELVSMLPDEQRLGMPGNHEHEHEHEHKGGRGREDEDLVENDPHFWTDPVLVQAIIPPLVKRLCRIDKTNCKQYKKRKGIVLHKLKALDRKIRGIIKPLKGKSVILFHSSFQYFLKRYGLKLRAVISSSPGKNPSPRYIVKLIQVVKKYNIRGIFSEPQLPVRPVEVIAESVNVRLFQLDPLGGSSGRISYYDLMIYNARQLLRALR